MIFASRLKQLRSDKHISQRDFSKIVGVTQQAIGKWEVGKSTPDYNTLCHLAQYFHVTTDYLLGRTDTPNAAASAPSLSSQSLILTDPREIDHIQKYRGLDERGKDNVDATTEHEYQYASPEARAEKQSG